MQCSRGKYAHYFQTEAQAGHYTVLRRLCIIMSAAAGVSSLSAGTAQDWQFR